MKNRLTYNILFLLLFLALPILLQAQSVSVRVANQVIQGQRFTVSITVSNGDASITRDNAPKLNGCTLLSGPGISTMQSVQIIGGQQTSNIQRDYTFTYLADKAGTVTVPSMKIRVNGKEMSTPTKTIQILPPDQSSRPRPNYGYSDPADEFDEWINQLMGGNPGRPPQQNSQPQNNLPSSEISAKDFLVTVSLSKHDLYEKEAVIATIKLYTKHDVTKFQPVVMPQFEGFLSEEIDVSNLQPQLEHLRGENYYSVVLKKCLLYPQKSGKLTINSGTYDVTLEAVEYVTNGFYATPVKKARNITTKSNSLVVNVKPLPTPVPASFTGAVGNFEVSASLKPEQLRTNEAAKYILEVKGTGNIKHLGEPIVNFPSTVEEYTPVGESDARFNGTNMQGTYTATYTFVPQQTGKLVIPSWQFTYFNPAKAGYVTVTLPAIERDVAKGIGGSSSSTATTNVDTDRLRDIRHIVKVNEDELRMTPYRVFYRGWYWIAYIVALLVLVAAIIMYRNNIKAKADIQGTRIKKAKSVAAKKLRKAHAAMTAKDSDGFYASLLGALVGFLSDKLKIPASSLTRDNIKETLANDGASEEIVATTINILDDCEMARFTPAHSENEMSILYSQASEVIDYINRLKPTAKKTEKDSVKSRYEVRNVK